MPNDDNYDLRVGMIKWFFPGHKILERMKERKLDAVKIHKDTQEERDMKRF